MKRFLRHAPPSPAMVVGVLAVALAATGTSIAGKGNKHSDKIGKKDLALSQQTAWAVVNHNGTTLLHSKGVTASFIGVSPAAVSYSVTFPGAVNGRPISVAPRDGDPVAITHTVCGPGSGCIGPGADDTKTVQVGMSRGGPTTQPPPLHGFVITILPK